MEFKITTLCENNIGHGSKNLIGEHGLSFYVEADNLRLLFDTGQNLGLANNADVLGIDLSRVDTVVLSHVDRPLKNTKKAAAEGRPTL